LVHRSAQRVGIPAIPYEMVWWLPVAFALQSSLAAVLAAVGLRSRSAIYALDLLTLAAVGGHLASFHDMGLPICRLVRARGFDCASRALRPRARPRTSASTAPQQSRVAALDEAEVEALGETLRRLARAVGVVGN